MVKRAELDPALRERVPLGLEWERVPVHPLIAANAISASAWRSGPIVACSALEIAEYPDGVGTGPQWHCSISAGGKRAKAHHVRRALRAFDMVGAEEDNHHPGVARNFWIPVDPAHRAECQCKVGETVVTEPDGYQWTNPSGDEPCRGCEYEDRFGRPCPIHVEARRHQIAARAEKPKAEPRAWFRVRFIARGADDYRPVTWPPPGPYWCTGECEDGPIIVAYVRSLAQVVEYWPEAADVEHEERAGFLFTSRFYRPEWFTKAMEARS